MEQTTHTPTPYHVVHNPDCRDGNTLNTIPTIYSGTTPIAKMRVLDRPKIADAECEMLATAEFFVLACNAHQDLVDVLKDAQIAIVDMVFEEDENGRNTCFECGAKSGKPHNEECSMGSLIARIDTLLVKIQK